jgi:hypothetical protein
MRVQVRENKLHFESCTIYWKLCLDDVRFIGEKIIIIFLEKKGVRIVGVLELLE